MKGDREEQKWPLVDTKEWVRGFCEPEHAETLNR